MNILGIWDGHDSGAAILVDGRVVAAVNEERCTRRKLEVRFPLSATRTCLEIAGLEGTDVDLVAGSTTDVAKTLARWAPWTKERYYALRRRKTDPGPLASFQRQVKYRLTELGPGRITRILSRVAFRRSLREVGINTNRVMLFDHHECHAISAAQMGGGRPSVVLTIDGLGDGLSSTVSVFDGATLERVAVSRATDSLGVFFEHVTRLLNMRELEDEGKVMALADFASPVPDKDNRLLPLVRVENGRIRTTRPGHALFATLKRIHWSYPNEQFAFMAQRVVERVCETLALDAVKTTGMNRLALSGGVTSNIKANRRIRLLPGVNSVRVFPHMGDGGLALGAAMAAAQHSGEPVRDELPELSLGPEFSDEVVAAALERAGLGPIQTPDLPEQVADRLVQGQVVLWFQGRMEYGPRALGNRSVLARPDRTDVRDRINLALKRRVWYQPFCPAMLESDAADLLSDWDGPTNPHMTMAYMVAPAYRARLAGVISLDGLCRPQIVPDDASTRFAALLRQMKHRLTLGAVLNTSYNVHGEPLVCTPEEAIDVFRRTEADALAIGRFLVSRETGSPGR